MPDSQADITNLLIASSTGNPRDVDRLMSAIYDDLKRIAASQLSDERPEHTLQPTALVHEAYIRLVNQRETNWKDRLHFFAIAARLIRRILIDHARERAAQKRGGGHRPMVLTDQDVAEPKPPVDILALDESLQELAELSQRQAQIVELRFFGGLTMSDIAKTLDIGQRSVDREWQAARAWLLHRLAE